MFETVVTTKFPQVIPSVSYFFGCVASGLNTVDGGMGQNLFNLKIQDIFDLRIYGFWEISIWKHLRRRKQTCCMCLRPHL